MKIEIKKEIANTITHGLGFITFAALIPLMFVRYAHSELSNKVTGLILFAVGLTLVYASSTIYHAIQHKKAKHVLRIADHISIYYLIAGTYTAIIVLCIPIEKVKIFLIVLWTVVGVGTIKKMFLTGKYDTLSTIIYVALGFLGIVEINNILHFVPSKALVFILLGGLSYLLGVIFYAWKKYTYHHAVWHLFVLNGSIMHFFSVWFAMGK